MVIMCMSDSIECTGWTLIREKQKIKWQYIPQMVIIWQGHTLYPKWTQARTQWAILEAQMIRWWSEWMELIILGQCGRPTCPFIGWLEQLSCIEVGLNTRTGRKKQLCWWLYQKKWRRRKKGKKDDILDVASKKFNRERIFLSISFFPMLYYVKINTNDYMN